jgi:hypothetical protein
MGGIDGPGQLTQLTARENSKLPNSLLKESDDHSLSSMSGIKQYATFFILGI